MRIGFPLSSIDGPPAAAVADVSVAADQRGGSQWRVVTTGEGCTEGPACGWRPHNSRTVKFYHSLSAMIVLLSVPLHFQLETIIL